MAPSQDPRGARRLLFAGLLFVVLFFALALVVVIVVDYHGGDDDDNDHGHHHYTAAAIADPRRWPRSIEGYGVRSDDLGSADAPMRRLTALAPGLSTDETSVFYPPGELPTPRELSNNVSAAPPNATGLCGGNVSDCGLNTLALTWWQFFDHDVALTASSGERLDIVVNESGTNKTVPFTRASYVYSGEGAVPARRQPVDRTTPFIDASSVYGNDDARAHSLRTFRGGKLKMLGNLLPLNGGEAEETANDANPLIADSHAFFLAGDERVNEQRILTSMHTLFVREHNRLADGIAARENDDDDDDSGSDDERIFQLARAAIIGQIQRIQYCEALPVLLGGAAQVHLSFDACDDDDSNDPRYEPAETDPRMPVTLNVLLRNMHSVIPEVLAGENITDQFFRPSALTRLGSDPLAHVFNISFDEQTCRVDTYFIEPIRNTLFGTMCEDLFSRNVQRARDVGAPYYNDARVAYGLAPITNFSTIPKLEAIYGGNVSRVEVFPGSLAEPHGTTGQCVGALTAAALNQFFDEAARADPLFFTGRWSIVPREGDSTLTDNISDDVRAYVTAAVRHATLRRIIVRNTALTEAQVPDDVWHVAA